MRACCGMAEYLCTIVTSEGGGQWVYLPALRRVFYNYAIDDKSQGWEEAQMSRLAMSKHMHYIKSDADNQPIPVA